MSNNEIQQYLERMRNAIRLQSENAKRYAPHATVSEQVLTAMLQIPRHRFVPGYYTLVQAYLDSPLPIEHGQTISQPYIVALMTSLAAPQPQHKVLEVGTGSGYQAAVLSTLVETVYTIDIVPELVTAAKSRFLQLNLTNIEATVQSGKQGWPEFQPFDSIVVTSAATQIPAALIEQLKPGGKLVIPLESSTGRQVLCLIEKQADGSVTQIEVLPVRFVPFK